MLCRETEESSRKTVFVGVSFYVCHIVIVYYDDHT